MGGFEEEQTGLAVTWRPDMDVFELPAEYLLTLSLPGVTADAVDVSLLGHTMVVSGERRLPIPADAVPHLIESSAGRFERRVRLPANAVVRRMQMQMSDGQLLLRVPKAAPHSVRVSRRSRR
jgi:HSP20 family protein